jgi:hypothetical protein
MASNIPEYVSDDEVEQITTEDAPKRKAKRDRTWTMEKKFSGSKEALEFIDTEKTSSFHYKNTTADGNKSYYRCNKIKLRCHQCPAGIYLLYDCRNEDVFLFRALENLKEWKVTLPSDASNEKWREGKCTCPFFLKKYMCKHIIGLAIWLKSAKPRAAAKDVPIGEKKKRGRPKQAKKALIIDSFSFYF